MNEYNEKTNIEISFIILNLLKESKKNTIVQYFKEEFKNLGLLIQKYIIYIQNHYGNQSKIGNINLNVNRYIRSN